MDNEQIAQQLVRTAKELVADIKDYINVDWPSYVNDEIAPAIDREADNSGVVSDVNQDGNVARFHVNLQKFSEEEFKEEEFEAIWDRVNDILDDFKKDDGIEYQVVGQMGYLGTWEVWLP